MEFECRYIHVVIVYYRNHYSGKLVSGDLQAQDRFYVVRDDGFGHLVTTFQLQFNF